MKKRIVVILVVLASLLLITGCDDVEPRESALNFKSEYEALNGEIMRDDIEYRTLDISEENPYIKVTPTDIVEKLENKETFYLYVGDPMCPWCRSGLEKMIEVAIDKGIKDIYYIDFWDDDHNEILRDLYEVQKIDKKYQVVKTQESAEGYDEILDAVSDFAQDYTLTKDDKVYDTGVKRIFGGDHFYFENGICKKYVSLRSEKLEKSIDDLTDEVLKDQESKFKSFLSNSNVCDGEENC